MALFYNCEVEEKEEIKINKKDYKEYLRNEIIFEKNCPVTSIAIIIRGCVALKNNKEYKKLEKNAIIGLSLIFSSSPFYDYNYVAVTNTTIKIINKNSLSNDFKILNMLSNYCLNLELHNKLLLIPNNIRLSLFLYYEYLNNNSLSFYIKYGKKELAEYLNISNITNDIKELKSKNIIYNNNKLYIINDLKLLKDTCSDYI